MIEIWKPIPGYEGLYEVSDQGRVRSLDRDVLDSLGRVYRLKGRILKLSLFERYPLVHLSVEGRITARRIHQLVLEAFVGPCPEGLEGCHENDVPTDNRLENLRWDSHRANTADAERNGRIAVGETVHASKLHASDIPVIRKSPLTQHELAAQYGVGQAQICRIKNCKRWRSVPDLREAA